MVEIKTDRLLLRNYEKKDAARIAEIANNINIARNMVDTFPHPYSLKDAEFWVGHAGADPKNKSNFAIVYDGEVVGGAGFDLKSGFNEGVASGGYWLGEDYWGKGIGTEVWGVVRDYAFENFDIRRLEAGVFGWNPASGRVQEKCGFTLEGRKKNSVIRFGDVCDEIMYGMTREGWEALKNGKGTL